jgi:hypothetical protein
MNADYTDRTKKVFWNAFPLIGVIRLNPRRFSQLLQPACSALLLLELSERASNSGQPKD